MKAVGQGARSRRVALALGASMAAIGAGLATPAAAQCAPDPTVANGTTTCTGTDADGIRVTTPSTTVNVAAGASVNANTRAAIGVDVPVSSYGYSSNTVNVAGKVTGTGQPGVLLNTNAGSAGLTLTVAAGGSITGTNALLLTQSGNSGYYSSSALASVDNSGTLTGTGGAALLANGSSLGFGTITNRAGSTIGGIAGAIGTLSNAGVIDGGANSAVNVLPNYGVYGTGWTNTGTIRSTSSAATVQFGTSSGSALVNSGTIANAGRGAAITGSSLNLQNQATGVIRSAGATAISGTAQLNLINLGSIIGDVVVATDPSIYYASSSTIDSSGGSVTGSLRLGAGDDTLIARYTGGRTLATGFSGTVDGGAGVNTEQVAFAANTSVTTPIDLATNFQRLGLRPATGVTATLENGFRTASIIVLAGTGSVINRGAIATGGQAVTSGYDSNGYLASFSNEGTISGTGLTSAGQYAVSLGRVSNFSNSGTISASGNAVSMSSGAKLTNTGSITASGTGVDLFDVVLDNRGAITSTGGTGVVLSGNVGYQASNSGTIRGATIGADNGVYLTNTGTITSPGTAVLLEAYGALINAAGGVVTGGNRAVSAPSFDSAVVNAGTINGAVTFGYGGSNKYIAQPGGILNGNLTLGYTDLLVTDIVNKGPGQFAGINGTVTAASGALLHYRVASDTAAVLGPVGPFAVAGYELSNNARLTLTASGTVMQPLVLAGTGSVDLNAAITTTTTSALQSDSTTFVPGTSSTPATSLAITNRGTISLVRPSTSSGTYYYSGAAVSLGNQDSFTNIGTVSIVEPNGYYGTTAITGGTGSSVINTGTIRLNGGYGVTGVGSLNNSGTIAQTTGGATAQGVSSVANVTNSGTISVGGAAVQLNFYSSSTLTNSGTLKSTGGAAVVGNPYGYGTTITNSTGGVIAGVGTAVQVSGGVFSNAGTVTGTVDLGYSSYGRSYASATYVANGGTIAGDLLFGSGNDTFFQTGATTGVSGKVDGGAGRNLYGRSFTSSGTFALDGAPVFNFQDRLAQAIGSDTVVTTTGALTGNLYATGTGGIVNQATVNGQLFIGKLGYNYPSAPLPFQDTPASVVNVGSVTGGVSGSTPSFTNSGAIGSARLTTTAVSLQDNGPLSFTNTGQIAAGISGYYGSAVQLSGMDAVSVANSGTINGGLSAGATFSSAPAGSLVVANSGTLSWFGTYAPALSIAAYSYAPDAGGSVTASNSGTVVAGGSYGFASAWLVDLEQTAAPISYSLVNSGAVSATATGGSPNTMAFGLQLDGGAQATGTVTNMAGGSITATASRAYALIAYDTPLVLDNAGLISALGTRSSVAIQTFDAFGNTIRNTGTITGDILLADGADRVENAGTIVGNVMLGAGDDVFVQRGGTVTGVVDGGDGADLLQVDASGGGSVAGAGFSNFERVQQIGTGAVSYSGAFGVGTIELTGGTLQVAKGQQLSTLGATTITGGAGGVSVAALGDVAGGITLGDGADSVTVGGSVGGPILLGGGNDSFRLLPGARLGGVVDGGAGYDTATLVLAGDTALTPAPLRNFEALATEGTGALVLTGGAFAYDRVSAAGDLVVAADANLAAPVTFGAGDNRFSIAGGFAGSVDGGAGSDTIEVAGGTAAAPVAFSTIRNVEAFRQSAGFATLAGAGDVGAMTLTGGRFVGLAGSVLTASQVNVGAGATFGSAGVVNGNLAVAGLLSPGASPGTMTVNGNVSLLGGSTSLFELTPAVSDKLVVNGAVAIAPGATVQLAPTGYTGGGALDLVTASGGVTGAFTELSKPAALNGFLSYQATRIQFVTSFTGDATFTPQTARALAYINTVLTSGQASAALLAGLPRLLTATGASSAAAFARVTPEAYASAQQIAVENGLSLAEAARGEGFTPHTEAPGLFTFGELQGDWRTLSADRTAGVARAAASAQGLLGGVGIGGAHVSLGAFAGYRWTSQRIAALDARTRFDGETLGLHARVHGGGFALTATGAYSGGDATTSRATPDGSARARYRLHAWTGDLSASYQLSLGDNWRLLPHVGGTVISELRGAATETGGSGFALAVQRRRETASFIDGGVTLGGGAAPAARVRPFVSLGARWQLEGRQPLALAGFGGGAPALLALGASRAKLVGTGALGLDAALSSRLSVFAGASGETGGADHRVAAHAGLRARF